MPYDDGSNDHIIEYKAVVGDMQGILDKCLGSKFVFGGDFNTEKHAVNPAQSCIAIFVLQTKCHGSIIVLVMLIMRFIATP